MPSEELKFNNYVKVTLKDALTSETIKMVINKNTITTAGKGLILDILGNDCNPILYGGVGTGSGATSAGTIALKNEIARNGCVFTRVGTTGTFSTFFNASEASGVISEISYFGGNSAYTSLNTGILMNRILLSTTITKTNSYTLTVDLDMTVA